MEIVQWSPDELRDQGAYIAPTLPTTAPVGPEVQPDSPGLLQTAIATLQRENTGIAIGQEISRRFSADGNTTEEDPTWNPYRFMRENWSEEQQKHFDAEIRGGLFEMVRNPAQLEIKRQQLGKEKELLDTMARGSGWGVFLGGLGAAATDLTTYIPVAGALGKARSASRTASLLGHASTTALQVGLQELALHSVEDLRTAKESFLNIGIAGALGAGLGVFARTLHPDHPLHPSNPLNPTHPDNLFKQGVGARTVDGAEDIVAHSDFGESSASAAQVGGAVNKEKGLFSNRASEMLGIKWLGEKITGTTPVGRALQWTGQQTRSIVTGLMDMGGVLTDTNRLGVATKASAEDIKADLMVSAHNLALYGERQYQALHIDDLGQSKGTFMFKGRVSEEQFNEVARRHLLGQFTDDDMAGLTRQYGPEAAQKISQRASDYAEKIHETNAFYEAELTKQGLVRDTAKVERLSGELKTLRQQKKDAQAQAAAASDADTTSIADLEPKIDAAKRELEHQWSLPAPLGREYGHAQMWDSHSIMVKESQFRDYMLEVLVDHPDESWLHLQHGITASEFEKLGKEKVSVVNGKDEVVELTPEAGREKRLEILREWGGDEYYHRLNRAEAKATAAADDLKQSKLDFLDTMRSYGDARTQVRQLKTAEARKYRDKVAGDLEHARAERAQAAAEADALVKAVEAARNETRARLEQHNPLLPDAGLAELTAAGEADAKQAKFYEKGVPENGISHGPSKVVRGTADEASILKIDQSANAARDKAFVNPIEAAKAPETEMTVAWARAEERAKAANQRLAEADRRVAAAEEKYQRVNQAWMEVRGKQAMWQSGLEFQAKELTAARTARGLASKDYRAAKRELLKATNATPLDKAIEEIRSNLMDRTALPSGIMEHEIQTTGRVKERRLNLTPEQRRAGEEAGFLRTDLPSILHGQYAKLSGYLGLHTGLDIGRGRTYASWADVLRKVDDEYDALTAKAGADPKSVTKLTAERHGAKKDINLLKDRLLGTEDMGVSRDSWTYWLTQKARQANFVRFGAGFLLPSLTDIATVAFRSGPISKLLINHGREVISIMRDMQPSELRAFVNGQELGHAGLRLAKGLDIEDGRNMAGIGTRGTPTHTVTSAIDRGMNWWAEKTPIVSGLRAWTRFWKIAAGVERAYKLRDMTAGYAKLSEKEIADLASLGVGRREASRINDFAQKFGTTDERGHWDPNLSEWQKTEQGRQAARDFRIAVQRDMNRAVFTPGIGDTPGIMSKWHGKMLLQFQTFAFSFMNRFLTPMSQRIATYKDAQAISTMAWLGASSMAVMFGKDIINGRDPSKRLDQENWGNTAKELIDRSGMLTFMSPYIDSALKLSAGPQEAAFGHVVVGPTDRYSRNGWMESLGGSTFGLLRDIQNLGSSVSQGEDGQKMLKKALVLTPFNTYSRLANQMATSQ